MRQCFDIFGRKESICRNHFQTIFHHHPTRVSVHLLESTLFLKILFFQPFAQPSMAHRISQFIPKKIKEYCPKYFSRTILRSFPKKRSCCITSQEDVSSKKYSVIFLLSGIFISSTRQFQQIFQGGERRRGQRVRFAGEGPENVMVFQKRCRRTYEENGR